MALDPLLLVDLAALAFLLLASAFFSMSETALISADRLRIRAARDAGDPRAVALERLLRDPERIITTVLVGNNAVNIAASVLSAVVAVELLGEVGPAVATGIMVFLVLVFAEITPKTFAVRHATAIALRIAGPMGLLEKLLRPAVVFFSVVAGGVLRVGGVKRPGRTPFITEEEIRLLLRVGEEQGTVEPFERKVINEVFDFTETKAHRVMTPRDKIEHLGREATLHDAVVLVNRSGYSRVLVVDRGLDDVLGFVHAKDLLKYTDERLKRTPVEEALRPVLVAQANLDSDELLTRMLRLHTQIAIVQDARGHTLGLLTIEDLLEELVGEIHDEFDVDVPVARPSGAEAPAHAPAGTREPPRQAPPPQAHRRRDPSRGPAP